MMKHPFLFLLFTTLACCLACGSKDIPTPTPENPAPTDVTLSIQSFSAPVDGGKFALTVTAPVRPSVSGLQAWTHLKDGTYYADKYQITYEITVDANAAYEERTATLTITAGSLSKALTITQAAAEKPVDPDLDPDPGVDPVPGTNDAWQLSEALGLGWNMGNHFDAFYNGSWAGENEGYPNETCWQGESATQATFDGVKKAGFTSVRIPISWLKMIGPAPDYAIDEAWMNRVYEVVGFAHHAGLAVIINTHHDENHGVNNTYQWLDIKNAANNAELNAQIKEEIAAVWTQIATKFADCGDWLIMESFNELNDGGWGWSDDFRNNPKKQCGILDQWNQVFVDAVRATGGNNATRWLGVPSYCANPGFTQYMTVPNDPAGKIMISVHFYDPYDYTIGEKQCSDWGHTGDPAKKANGGDEDYVKQVFNMLRTKYVDQNIPVYIGEFGCSMRRKSDTRAWAFFKYYLEYIVKAAKTYGMPSYLWDNGAGGNGQEQHGYINHGTGNYIGNSKEVVDVMVKARFTNSSSYTLQTVYNNAPKF